MEHLSYTALLGNGWKQRTSTKNGDYILKTD